MASRRSPGACCVVASACGLVVMSAPAGYPRRCCREDDLMAGAVGQARDARRAAGFRCCGAHLYDATDPELVRRWRCQEGPTVPVPILMPGLGMTLVAAPPDPRTKYAAGSLTCPRATPPRRGTGTGGRTGTTTSPRPGRPGVAGVS